MEEKETLLAIAEQLADESDESDPDSDLEEEYQEDELFLSLVIQQRKKTLRDIVRRGDSYVNGTKSKYSAEVARVMDDHTFKTHFGMTRDTFQVLRDHLHGRVTEKYVDLDTRLMVTLWMLGTHDSYRTAGERFDLHGGTVHFIFKRLCKELAAMSDQFISWPAPHQRPSLAAKFQEKTGFPGVVGCVGSTYVQVKEPIKSHFSSKVSFHTVQVQSACDADLKFTHVHMWHQSCDQNVLENHEFIQLTEELGNQYHVLGDLTYPLNKGLLTPYQSGDQLLEWQRKYNQLHQQACSQIDFAFAQLKVRFWRLNSLDMFLKDKVSDVILACCVLHNIIVEHEGQMEMTHNEMKDILGGDSHDPQSDHHSPDIISHCHSHPPQDNSPAASKRERIARKLL